MVRSPGGMPPPDSAQVGGARVPLDVLVKEICDLYYERFPDEHQRYGDEGVEWCHHDNRWLLLWAADDLRQVVDLTEQACWLARVLHGKGFPVERLVVNLKIASEVVANASLGAEGDAMATRLADSSVVVSQLELTRAPE